MEGERRDREKKSKGVKQSQKNMRRRAKWRGTDATRRVKMKRRRREWQEGKIKKIKKRRVVLYSSCADGD